MMRKMKQAGIVAPFIAVVGMSTFAAPGLAQQACELGDVVPIAGSCTDSDPRWLEWASSVGCSGTDGPVTCFIEGTENPLYAGECFLALEDVSSDGEPPRADCEEAVVDTASCPVGDVEAVQLELCKVAAAPGLFDNFQRFSERLSCVGEDLGERCAENEAFVGCVPQNENSVTDDRLLCESTQPERCDGQDNDFNGIIDDLGNCIPEDCSTELQDEGLNGDSETGCIGADEGERYCGRSVGEPVDMLTGTHWVGPVTDFTQKGPAGLGADLSVTRFYDSKRARNDIYDKRVHALPNGWRHSYEMTLSYQCTPVQRSETWVDDLLPQRVT